MSSEERRKRVHETVQAQKQAEENAPVTGRRPPEPKNALLQEAEAMRERLLEMQKQAQGKQEEARGKEENKEAQIAGAQGKEPDRTPKPKPPLRSALLLLAGIFLLCFCALAAGRLHEAKPQRISAASQTETEAAPTGRTEAGDKAAETGKNGGEAEQGGAAAEETPEETPLQKTLREAERLASMYDYDAAIALLREDAALSESAEAKAAVSAYEETKTTLVRQDILSIPHVFFHILVVDADNAFDRTKWGKQADGYNSLMTTIPEFEKMLEALYEDGYVLVGLHDMAEMEEQADGSYRMTEKDILLPPGKKALVMSEDDVCYYEYMEGAGFADRMIVGDDGRPTCVYTDGDGTEHIGDYDLVPILDHFIDAHPDFSYRGAKAIIAFTGYNGILGYRTDETYDKNSDQYDPGKKANPNIEADRQTAREVVKALREDGYELASHSWGHRDMGAISLEHLQKDTDRWDKNVNQALLSGECDILIYPKGADVADWRGYTRDNEKFDYLWNKGFRYFCNVDAAHPYWVQLGSDSLRQGRRPLDGLALWNDIANGKNRLSDLFPDVSAIFDEKRPTPVPEY